MVDARKLAELARTHLLPTIWVAGPDLRGQRKLLRGRAYLVRLRTMRRGGQPRRLQSCHNSANCRLASTSALEPISQMAMAVHQ